MAYHLVSMPSTRAHAEYVLDSDADVENLPTADAPGSVAYTADAAAHVYMLSPAGSWEPFGWGGDDNG